MRRVKVAVEMRDQYRSGTVLTHFAYDDVFYYFPYVLQLRGTTELSISYCRIVPCKKRVCKAIIAHDTRYHSTDIIVGRSKVLRYVPGRVPVRHDLAIPPSNGNPGKMNESSRMRHYQSSVTRGGQP